MLECVRSFHIALDCFRLFAAPPHRTQCLQQRARITRRRILTPPAAGTASSPFCCKMRWRPTAAPSSTSTCLLAAATPRKRWRVSPSRIGCRGEHLRQAVGRSRPFFGSVLCACGCDAVAALNSGLRARRCVCRANYNGFRVLINRAGRNTGDCSGACDEKKCSPKLCCNGLHADALDERREREIERKVG